MRLWRAWDLLEGRLCSTIGCNSRLAKRSHWPHRLICTPVATFGFWLEDRLGRTYEETR